MIILSKLVYNLRNSLNKPSNTRNNNSYVPEQLLGKTIPKIIHQTYSSKSLPIPIQENVDRIRSQNPNWEYRLYDDDDIEQYIAINYPKLLAIYKKINPKYGAAKADFFRYLVMYREGGVYLDIKSGLDYPLDEIVSASDSYVLSHWPRSYPKNMLGQHPGITNPTGELQQWHIISVAGHPFLKAVIDNVCSNILHYNPLFHDFGSWGVFNLTGPIAYTEAIYPLLPIYSHRLACDHLALGLVYYAIGPRDMTSGHHKIFQNKHYSTLEESIVKQPFHINLLFSLTKPLIKRLKIKLKSAS